VTAKAGPFENEEHAPGAEKTGRSFLCLTDHRDLTQWFRASFIGTLFCIVLLTLFGFILVSGHARLLSSQMQLFVSSGMEPLVRPDDPYLTSFIHRLGSALFFGCTLGVLNAMAAMALSLFPWIKGRFSLPDLLVFPVLAGLCAYLGYSAELPALSILFGVLSPVVFFIPWSLIIRKSRPRDIRFGRWIAFAVAASAPFLFLLVLGGSSFGVIRDSMLTRPVLKDLSDFYYNHTLLAAHVIKPISALEQKVIAVSDEIEKIGPMPHGSLWVRTPDPCGVSERNLAVSRGELPCNALVIGDDRPANASNRIMEELGRAFDSNERMRQGIGIFFYRGPLVLVPILFMLWFALFLSNLSMKSKIASGVVLLGYLALFYPAWQGVYQRHLLVLHPERIAQYILSEREEMRYLALLTYPDEFTARELMRYSGDVSPRIRLRALYEAGRRGNTQYLDMLEEALSDPQLNVRTRACWALGRTRSERSADLLQQAFLHDPSWYVRGYAYRALGGVRPMAKVITAP